MEKRTILIWAGVGILGVGIMTGVVLLLRAYSAPAPLDNAQLTQTQKVAPLPSKTAAGGTAGVQPYVSIDKTPVAPAYKGGQYEMPKSSDTRLLPVSNDGKLQLNK